jgi:hypothetical protein
LKHANSSSKQAPVPLTSIEWFLQIDVVVFGMVVQSRTTN